MHSIASLRRRMLRCGICSTFLRALRALKNHDLNPVAESMSDLAREVPGAIPDELLAKMPRCAGDSIHVHTPCAFCSNRWPNINEGLLLRQALNRVGRDGG